MDIQPFSLHEQALKFRAHRNTVLSANIANADTPGYKARDVEFHAALDGARAGLHLARTNARHQAGETAVESHGELKYRMPVQPSLDGNTVETDVEQAAFAENAVQYRASLAFLNGKIRTLRFALKGSE